MALLDTTVLIDLMKESKRTRSGPASSKLVELIQRGEVLQIAIFRLAELYVAVTKSMRPDEERLAIDGCIAPFEVLPFERSTAEVYGSIVGELELLGQPIADIDALIGSVALERGELLVTRNRKHFDRIAGLHVEGY